MPAESIEALTECVVNDHPTHVGKCFCGAVEFSVTGEPEVMGYCHCGSCREWGAAPVNAFTLWRRDKVQVTKGIDKVGCYRKTPQIESVLSRAALAINAKGQKPRRTPSFAFMLRVGDTPVTGRKSRPMGKATLVAQLLIRQESTRAAKLLRKVPLLR